MTATEGLVEPPRSLVEALRAAADGEIRAREELSSHCLPQLTSFAQARGAIDPGGVADTVMVEFLGRLDRLHFDSSGQMWAYLYQIARSRVIDERRASKPIELREHTTIEELLPPSSGMEDQVTERHYVDDLLASLTSEQREVLQMRFLDDLSIEETATRTGRTLTAVKGLQRRAIRAITAAALLAVVLIGGLILALTDGDDGIPTVSEGPPPTSGFSSDRAVVDDPAAKVDSGGVVEPNDTGEPDTTITAEELGLDGEPFSASFEFDGLDATSGIDRFECRLDGGDFEACSSPQRYDGLSEGGHLFEVRAVDRTGNADPTPAIQFWVIERPAGFPAGVDPAVMRASTEELSCSGAKGTWAELVDEGYDVVVGTDGDDVIDVSGGDRPDIVIGLDGNDTIITGDGDDRVCGGGGNDTITTGNGNDRISGANGNDSIDAGSGNDRVWAGSGTDTVIGRGGNDNLSGDGGNDRLDGGDGDDQLRGGGDVDVLIGGGGRDRCEMPELAPAPEAATTTSTTAPESKEAEANDAEANDAERTTTSTTEATSTTTAPAVRVPVETVDRTCELDLDS